MTTLQTRPGTSLSSSHPVSTGIPEPLSPIAGQLDTLAATLACAQEGLTLLYMKLEPLRAVSPSEGLSEKRPPAASPMEGRLADLIDSAAFLNTSLSNLRAELRI